MFDSDLTSLDWLTSVSAQCPSVEVDASSSPCGPTASLRHELQQQGQRQPHGLAASSSSSHGSQAQHEQQTSDSASDSTSGANSIPTLSPELLSWLDQCAASSHEDVPSAATPPKSVTPKQWRQQMAQAAKNVTDLIAHALAEAQQTKPTGLTSLQIVKAIVTTNPCLSKRQQIALKTSVRQELLNSARFRRARKGKSDKPSCNACWILSSTSAATSKGQGSKHANRNGHNGKRGSHARRRSRQRAGKRRHAAASSGSGSNSDSGGDEADRDYPPHKRGVKACHAQEASIKPHTSTPPPALDLFRHDWDTLLDLAGEADVVCGSSRRAVSRGSTSSTHSDHHVDSHPKAQHQQHQQHQQHLLLRPGHCTPLAGGMAPSDCPDGSMHKGEGRGSNTLSKHADSMAQRRHRRKRGKRGGGYSSSKGSSSSNHGTRAGWEYTSGSAMSDCDSEGVSSALSASTLSALGSFDDLWAFGDPLFDETDLQMELPPTPTFGLPGAHSANLGTPTKAFPSSTFSGSLGLGAHHLLLPTNASRLSSTTTSSPRSLKGEEEQEEQAAAVSKGDCHTQYTGSSDKCSHFVSSFTLALSDEESCADDNNHHDQRRGHAKASAFDEVGGNTADDHSSGTKGQGALPFTRLLGDATGDSSYTAFPFGDLGSSFTTAHFRQLTPAM